MTRKTYKRVIVTDELIEKINPVNTKLSVRFLKEKAQRASPVTIKGYASDSNIFFVWNLLHNENKTFTDIKKLEFSDFFSFTTEDLRWGSSRTNRVRSFLSSLSIFIEKFLDEEYPDFRNVILKVIDSVPKDARREKTILSSEQVESLLEHLSKTDSQKAFWLALACYSGSRFSELLRFTTDNLDENHTAFGDIFMETIKPIKTKGRGREGKMLLKYILKDKFLPYYKQWLLDRNEIMKRTGQEHTFFFIKSDGTPATAGTVRSWVATMETWLGVNLYPHSLRHFITTELSRKNIPPLLVKDLMGWNSLDMVEVYNDLSSKDREWKELDNLR